MFSSVSNIHIKDCRFTNISNPFPPLDRGIHWAIISPGKENINGQSCKKCAGRRRPVSVLLDNDGCSVIPGMPDLFTIMDDVLVVNSWPRYLKMNTAIIVALPHGDEKSADPPYVTFTLYPLQLCHTTSVTGPLSALCMSPPAFVTPDAATVVP